MGPTKALPLEEQIASLVRRKQQLEAKEPAWNGRATRDREIAAINTKIDRLLDEWLTKRP